MDSGWRVTREQAEAWMRGEELPREAPVLDEQHVFQPGERVRVGASYGTVVPPHETVRVRLDTGLEYDFARRVVVPLDEPEVTSEVAS